MSKRKIMSVLIILVVLIVSTTTLFAGGASEKKAGAATKTYAIVYPIVHPFFEPVTVSAEAYAKKMGYKVITRAPEGVGVNQQIEIMENLIAMKVDGIAIVPTDPDALAPYIDKAIDAGIPTICFESDNQESKRLAFLGTYNYNAGRHLGSIVGRELNGKGTMIICTGLPTQRSLNERIQGIEDELAENFPGVKILDIQTGQGDPNLTVNVIETQIQAYPDFDVFTSIDATGGPAAVAIWKSLGWTKDDHKIITFDDMEENVQGVRDGQVTSIVSQKQWLWGELIIKTLDDILDGKTVADSTDTGTVEITIANVDTYRN
ncbi:MAG: substrate-binding domain-containing protein [Sphaerochaetaceae bacterium]|jgi:ribose transport system substrate-binding protein